MAAHPLAEVLNHPPTGTAFSLGQGISMVIGSFIVGAVVAPDVTRYSKSPRQAVFAAVFGFFIAVPLVIVCGIFMSHGAGTWDLVDIMIKLGWGVIALLMLILAQWTTNDQNLYCSALGFAVVLRNTAKWKLTAISGLLGIILAVWGIYDQFIPWLNFLSALITPMGGVIVADYYFFHKDFYNVSQISRFPETRWLSFAAWIIGSLGAYITGQNIISLTTVPAVDGFLIGLIAHVILMKVPKSVKSKDTIDLADAKPAKPTTK